jgi:hypothetical protein
MKAYKIEQAIWIECLMKKYRTDFAARYINQEE